MHGHLTTFMAAAAWCIVSVPAAAATTWFIETGHNTGPLSFTAPGPACDLPTWPPTSTSTFDTHEPSPRLPSEYVDPLAIDFLHAPGSRIDDALFIDNNAYPAGPVPEPAVALFLLAGVTIILVRRRDLFAQHAD